MTNPLVSICSPTYHGSRWIRATIASALAQDYPQVEVVVFDDASMVGTAEAALAVADERVRVVASEHHIGMARNWSRSAQFSRGDYVKFLMQDDALEPTCVGRMADLMARNPSVGLVFTLRRIEPADPSDAASARLRRKLEDLPAKLGPLREVDSGRAIFDAMRRTRIRWYSKTKTSSSGLPGVREIERMIRRYGRTRLSEWIYWDLVRDPWRAGLRASSEGYWQEALSTWGRAAPNLANPYVMASAARVVGRRVARLGTRLARAARTP